MTKSDRTTTLLVRGLHGEGPRDIVGAFANEGDIDPDSIGNIDISGSEARVEVGADEAPGLCERMDGGEIGRSTVTIQPLDEHYREREKYASRYGELVQLEREEEMRRHEEEIRSLSGRERENRGRAVLHLRGRDEGEGLGGYHVKLMRQKHGEPLPDTEISVGDLVMISKNDPLRDDNPTGTVIKKTNYSITAAFDPQPAEFVYGKGLRADLYVNDITYQRMLEALDTLKAPDATRKHLANIIVQADEPETAEPISLDEWENPTLNESQKTAVEHAVAAPDFFLIHGPPGTGKTTTAVEVIQQCVNREESVLATAASNTAVDNVIEMLAQQDVNVLRVGHPARVTPVLHQHTLDVQIEDHPDYQQAHQLREEAFDLQDKQDDLTHPSGRWRRGMSDEKIQGLAEKNQGSRGVPAEKIREMSEWLEIQNRIDDLFAQSDKHWEKAIDDLITRADVVCATNSTAGSSLMEGRTFDTLVIDEATQATEPSCLIPLTHADRVIMAGDHHQLPPTVQNQEAADKGLRRSLFEKLADQYPQWVQLLRRQYRMHEQIMAFSSSTFYDGKIEADPSVRSHTLNELGGTTSIQSGDPQGILTPTDPLVFVNTSNLNAPERRRTGSTSLENPVEAAIAANLTRQLISSGVDPSAIAVITPYRDQLDRLEQDLDVEHLEIDTVDGFQGREKEVVLVSLVRRNDANEIGFLREHRRFNVALTRARRKVIVIGDEATIRTDPLYVKFIRFADMNGRHVDLLPGNGYIQG